jgi:SAM-dependent methyltransferase
MKLHSLVTVLPGAQLGKDLLDRWRNAIQSQLARQKRETEFNQEFKAFKKLCLSPGSSQRFDLRWQDRQPCLEDRTATTGFDRHYIYHPAWAARIIANNKPSEHTDISSTLNFCAILSAFVPVRFYDYRPPDLRLDKLRCGSADLLKLPFSNGSIASLSCMHVVEHIGLGRYGEPLDPDGDLKAMKELRRVLAPGGSLYLVVPVGIPRICYNAHRIYSFRQVREVFNDLELKEFTLIPDDPIQGGLIQNPPETIVAAQKYGCGCFWFRRNP